MRNLRRAILFVSVLLTFSIQAADPVYDAIRAARPDTRVLTLTDFAFDRDAYHFTLSGNLHLLSDVEGKTFGAVFVGNGSYVLTPATAYERRQLAIVTNDDKLTTLTDQFESAVFFSTDLLAAAAKVATKTEIDSAKAKDVYDSYLKKQRKDFSTNIHLRVAQQYLNGGEPFFFASIDGKKLPPAILAVDPLGADALRIAQVDDAGEQTILFVTDPERGGLWYMERLRADLASGQRTMVPPIADAEHYQVAMTVASRDQIEGTTTITFSLNHRNVRLLPVNLMSRVRISDVSFATAAQPEAWTSVPYVQEAEKEDADAAVIFPTALQAGVKYLLKFTYKGKDVLTSAGDGNYSVGARTSWYPNLGTFSDLATFEVTYRVPQKMQIVGVGKQAEDRVDGDQRVSVWKTDSPVRVAGFNYGRFKKMSKSDKDSGMTVDVYTNPGTPQVIDDINRYLEAMHEQEGGPNYVRVDTANLAQSALADGINTARTGKYYFGSLPFPQVAITQQSEWSFGQSWPSLIYMPYIAFLNGTTRNTLGLNGAKDFIDAVGPHEFAHQWWGHQVGWNSYRDQWLSEGFAEFTAALVLQQGGGWPKYNDFFEKARRHILEKPRAATLSNADAGPISQGQRLVTWRNPQAYDAIVYSKGAYVVHMLRMAMQDRANQKDPDARFAAMMTDFATTYAGRNPSTLDFQHIVEKHATPSLKVTQDGTLDWFFQQWVSGTSIPKYDAVLKAEDIGGGKYRVTGTITQSMVDDNFIAVVPIYVNFDKGAMAQLAAAPLMGNSTRNVTLEVALPRAPKSVTVNNNHDILAR
jgi:hypothetical protein